MNNLLKINLLQSFKELVRQLLFSLNLYKLLKLKRGGYNMKHLNNIKRKDIFKKIYDLGIWVENTNQLSRSGSGSELEITEDIINEIKILVNNNSWKTLLDIGCGDFNWFSKVDLDSDYLGIDIVPSLIKQNIEKYQTKKINFMVMDAVDEDIPKADVVLCREVIFHLNFEDGKKLIKNIKRHSKWLIITSNKSIIFNSNIPTGDYRMLNLECYPFNFPEPLKIIKDDKLIKGRILGLWKTKDLQ